VVTGKYLRVRTAGRHRVRRQVHRRLVMLHGNGRSGRYSRHVAVLALPQVHQARVVGRVQRELSLQLVVQVAAAVLLGIGRLGGIAPAAVHRRVVRAARRWSRRPRSAAAATHPMRVVMGRRMGGAGRRRRDVGHGPGQRLFLVVAGAGLLQRQTDRLALDLSTAGRALSLGVLHQPFGDRLDGLQTALGMAELAFVAVRALFAVRTGLRADGRQTDARRFAPEKHVEGRTRTAQRIVRRHKPVNDVLLNLCSPRKTHVNVIVGLVHTCR